ncbi:hypothetical protein [Embleya sp. NBC_00896]|nr:hypothetical protein OG928_00395 [Embleya sp. NBC_00896]
MGRRDPRDLTRGTSLESEAKSTVDLPETSLREVIIAAAQKGR